jgi:hypothetical protein
MLTASFPVAQNDTDEHHASTEGLSELSNAGNLSSGLMVLRLSARSIIMERTHTALITGIEPALLCHMGIIFET